MLDRRTGILLNKLNELCTSTSFNMIEGKDLLLEGEDGDSLKSIIDFLADKGYLELRYAEDEEYCVRMLPEGRLYSERAALEKREEARRSRKETVYAFFGALIGAFIGGGIVALIAALV